MTKHSITRRGLFRATASASVAAAGVSVLAGCKHKSEEGSSPVVVGEESATNILESYQEAEQLPIAQQGGWSISLGNVLHPGEGSWVPCTTAGSSSNPMVKGGAFSISTGQVSEVVPKPLAGDASNVAIYDVRCSDSAYAWVELNLLTHDWTLYAAAFADGALSGTPSTLWSAGSDYDPPRFAVTDSKVLWQVMPSASGDKRSEHSFCYLWQTGDTSAQAVVESPGRFATEPAVSDGTVTLVPRVNADQGTFYGITAYSLSDKLSTKIDQLVLPASVRPLNAVRIGDRFAFSIEASYSSGGLLGKMGTYIGSGEGPFVMLSREPTAAVTGKGDTFVIKSTSSYFVVDTNAKTYSVLSASNRCIDYGEYPATLGTSDHFVTFATVKDEKTGYPSAVAVRSFAL